MILKFLDKMLYVLGDTAHINIYVVFSSVGKLIVDFKHDLYFKTKYFVLVKTFLKQKLVELTG